MFCCVCLSSTTLWNRSARCVCVCGFPVCVALWKEKKVRWGGEKNGQKQETVKPIHHRSITEELLIPTHCPGKKKKRKRQKKPRHHLDLANKGGSSLLLEMHSPLIQLRETKAAVKFINAKYISSGQTWEWILTCREKMKTKRRGLVSQTTWKRTASEILAVRYIALCAINPWEPFGP